MTAIQTGFGHVRADAGSWRLRRQAWGDCYFHAHCLHGTDIIWAWALVGAALLLPTLIL